MKIFHLPDLGEGLAEAEIREWYVKEGDTVVVDQPLVSMETAKAVVDVPSPYAGKILKLYGDVNAIVPTGAPLISFAIEETNTEKPKGSVVGSLEEGTQSWQEEPVIIGAAKSNVKNVKAMPAARVLANEMQIDLAHVVPTGANGLITSQDVKKFMEGKIGVSAASHEMNEKLHGVRRTMAQAMALSHREVVPVTLIEDADITDFPVGTDVTVKLLQALIKAVKVEPSLNAFFDEKTLSRTVCDEVNVGLAVDTQEGLFVPVIKKAESLSTKELRKIIDEYKAAVKARSIASANLQGATISLSNFGTITGRYATPIIVPPMVAILGCGKSRQIPIVRNAEIIIGKILPLSLTFDHRAVTGGEATRFLGKVIEYLTENSSSKSRLD